MIYILSAFGICLLIFAIRAAMEWLSSTAINDAARFNQCHGRESAELRRRILRKIEITLAGATSKHEAGCRSVDGASASRPFTQPHPDFLAPGRAPTVARSQGVEVGSILAGGDDQTIASQGETQRAPATSAKMGSPLISAPTLTARLSQQPGVSSHNSLTLGFLISVSPTFQRR